MELRTFVARLRVRLRLVLSGEEIGQALPASVCFPPMKA